jgi:hypothetical protein
VLLIRIILAGVLAGAAPASVLADPTAPAASAPPVAVAQGGTCAGACQVEHDRCRVQTKGSPACDAARQRCLQACLATKRR